MNATTPSELLQQIEAQIKEKLPHLNEDERRKILQTVSRFCKTKESVSAFLKGYNSK